jgi:Ala-tRNA(Pro) deacylase
MTLTEKIKTLLLEHSISFKEVDHEPSPDCITSAQNRNEDLKIGGKSLLLKSRDEFKIFVLSAAKEADSKKIRAILRSQKLRFATKEELLEFAGVEKGALPPFGRPVQPFDLYLDRSILQNEKIAFNAGILTKSFIISVEDYLKLVKPFICDFSKD